MQLLNDMYKKKILHFLHPPLINNGKFETDMLGHPKVISKGRLHEGRKVGFHFSQLFFTFSS